MTTLAAELEAAVRIIKRVVSAAVPGAVTGDEALSLVALFAEAERSASSGVARLTPVVTETGSYAKSGHGTAADWLARSRALRPVQRRVAWLRPNGPPPIQNWPMRSATPTCLLHS